MLRRELSKELWEAMPVGGCGMYGVAGSPGDEPTRECFTGLVNGMDGIGFWRVSVHRERSSRLVASSKACARCCVPVSLCCWCALAQLVCPRFTVRLACVPRSHYIVRVLGCVPGSHYDSHASPVHITTRMRPWFTLRLACVPGSHYLRGLQVPAPHFRYNATFNISVPDVVQTLARLQLRPDM
jgi:hypothetical protein